MRGRGVVDTLRLLGSGYMAPAASFPFLFEKNFLPSMEQMIEENYVSEKLVHVAISTILFSLFILGGTATRMKCNIVKNISRQFLTMQFSFFLDFECKNWYKIEYKLNTIIVKLGTSENYIAL